MAPKVSVIVPAYNMAHYLPQAIQSVLNQTFTDFELILIDDGSMDGTREAAGRYADRLRYFHQPNQGRAGARNAGLQMAAGEYAAFLDADDVWNPDRLERGVLFLDRNSQIGLVHGEVDVIDLNGNVNQSQTAGLKNFYRQERRKGSNYLRLLDQCAIFSSTILFRRPLGEEIGAYDTSFKILEDYDWYLRFASKYPIALLGEPAVARYRIHKTNSVSQFGPDTIAKIYIKILEKQLAQLESQRSPSKKQRSRILKKLVEFHWRIRDQRQVKARLLEAFRLDPLLLLDGRSVGKLLLSL